MFLLVLAGCNHKTSDQNNNQVQQPGVIDISDENHVIDVDDSSANDIVEINMIAKQWVFEPDVITVNKGDTVNLHINSIDVDHGIGLATFGVDEKLEAGKVTDVEFVADKVGTFTFFCNVMCGQGHREMTGQLIVK